MLKRKNFDDLLKQRSPDEIKLVQDSTTGSPRLIKKKPIPREEIYQNETELKKAAASLLSRLPRCRLLKTDNGPLIVGRGRRVKTREPGMSDQHLCITGLFVSLEAKMPGEDLKPDQVDYKRDIIASGGIHITYHSLYELVEELKKHRLVSRKFEIN